MKNHIYIGIYLLLFLLFLCVIPVVIFYSSIQEEIIKILFYVGASGGIGGSLNSIRGFYQHLGGQTFKSNWTWWYIFRPIISVIVGIFAYFLIVGGLLGLSNKSDAIFGKGIMFYCAISFLAGFSFSQFADKLNKLSERLFAKKNSKVSGF